MEYIKIKKEDLEKLLFYRQMLWQWEWRIQVYQILKDDIDLKRELPNKKNIDNILEYNFNYLEEALSMLKEYEKKVLKNKK